MRYSMFSIECLERLTETDDKNIYEINAYELVILEFS
jgi:hypothetical protein